MVVLVSLLARGRQAGNWLPPPALLLIITIKYYCWADKAKRDEMRWERSTCVRSCAHMDGYHIYVYVCLLHVSCPHPSVHTVRSRHVRMWCLRILHVVQGMWHGHDTLVGPLVGSERACRGEPTRGQRSPREADGGSRRGRSVGRSHLYCSLLYSAYGRLRCVCVCIFAVAAVVVSPLISGTVMCGWVDIWFWSSWRALILQAARRGEGSWQNELPL